MKKSKTVKKNDTEQDNSSDERHGPKEREGDITTLAIWRVSVLSQPKQKAQKI